MNSFQAAAVAVVGYNVTVGISTRAGSLVGLGESVHALIRDIVASYQADALELGQGCKSGDGLICEMLATTQVNVADPVAGMNKPLDSVVRDVATVS